MTGFGRILVPLDGSERAEAALGWAYALPARHIRLLQVCPQEQPDTAAAGLYLEGVAARKRPPGAAIETRVVLGGPVEGIVGDAGDTDLIIMCTQGAGGGGRLLFGSVADRVARHAPVPTLLLRGGDDPVSPEPIRRVVIPLDGSTAAERALPLAAALGRMLGTRVHLITVSDSIAAEGERDSGVRPRGLSDAARAACDHAAGAYLEREAENLRTHDILTSTEVRSGIAAIEIMATIGPGDMLVMTTHGHGAARRWQIGNVAEKLLRQAAAPVVLVRADSL